MPNATEVAVKCPQCGKFLAALEETDTGVRVACHGLSIRVERLKRETPEDSITRRQFDESLKEAGIARFA